MLLSKDTLLDFRQADFSKSIIEEMSIRQLIQAAHWAHLNYIFIDKGTFSQETIEKVRKAGYTIVIGYGDVARIKISW